jgi:hypothetical protein
MVEAALYLLTGAILYAGAHQLYLGIKRNPTQPHAQLAALYLLFAAFVLAAVLAYQVREVSSPLQSARFSVTLGILLWIALIWYVAFHARCRQLLPLDLLTAAWIIFLIRNTSASYGLLGADIAPTDTVTVSSWWTALKFTALASLLFCYYAGTQMFRRGDIQAALLLVCALSILLAAWLADHLLNTPVVHSLYLAPFGFIGFLLVNSLYFIVLNYQKRRDTIRLPVVHKLTFRPEQTPFACKVADLRPPLSSDGESEVALHPIRSAAAEMPVIEPGSASAGNDSRGETDRQVPRQEGQTPLSKQEQSSLTIVSDNLIDIAVYATVALKRFKRGDADPPAMEVLCRKIRTKAIETRRLANKLSRPGNGG